MAAKSESQCDKGYLTINELDSVLRKVWEARSKWQSIGLALGVSHGDLEAIKASNSDDTDKCFQQVLATWLRSRCRPTSWRVLADALRSTTVGYDCLADSIVDGRDNSVNVSNGDSASNSISGGGDENVITFQCPCEKCSLESYVSDGCPRQESYPYLDSTKLTKDETNNLIQVLNSKTDKIKEIFRDLSDSMCVSLKERKKPVEELVRHALNIMVNNNSEAAPFTLLKEHQEELKRATTVDGVFIALIPHMSFFNYGILKHLIEKLGSENDKKLLAEYISEFSTFCQQRVFEVSPLRVGVSGTKKCKVKKFAVLLTKHDNKATLMDVDIAAEKFANLLGLKRSALNVEVIDSGSVLLVLSLPTFIADGIFPLDPILLRCLKENGFILFAPEDSHEMAPVSMRQQTESSQENLDQTELQTRCDSHESRSRQLELAQKSFEQSSRSESDVNPNKRILKFTGENQEISDYISKEDDDSPGKLIGAPLTSKSDKSTMTSEQISPFSSPVLSKVFDTHMTDVVTAIEGKEFAEMFVPLWKECLQDPNSAAVQAFLAHVRKIDLDNEASVKQEFYQKGCKVIALTVFKVIKGKRLAHRLQDTTNKDIAKYFELLKDVMCDMFAFQPDDSKWKSIIKDIQSKALECCSKLCPEELTGSAIGIMRSSATYYIEEVAVVPGSSIEYDPIYSLPPGVQPSAVLNIRMIQWQEAKSEDALTCKCKPQAKWNIQLTLVSNTLTPLKLTSVNYQQLLQPSLLQPRIIKSDSEPALNCSESICNYLDFLVNKLFSLTSKKASEDIIDMSLSLIEELVESTFFKVAAPLLVTLLHGTLNGISQLRAYQFLVKSLTKIQEREDIPQFEKWFLNISCEYISKQGESIKNFQTTLRELLSFLFTQKSRDLVSEATNSACLKKEPSLNFILESIINLYIPQISLLPAQCSIRSVIYFLRGLLQLKDQKKRLALNGITEAVWLNPELSDSAAKVFTYLLPHDYFNMVNDVESLVVPPGEFNLELYKREKEIESKITSQEMTHYDAALWYLDLMTTDATINSADERVLCLLKAAQHVAYAFSRVAVGQPLHFAYKNAVMMLAYDASQLATESLQPGARIFALHTAYQLTCFVSKIPISDPSQHSCLNGRVAIGLLRNLHHSAKFTFLLSQPMTADNFWVAAAPYIAKVSASAYNAYIQQLLQIPDENLPMKRSLLHYQIMEMCYQSGHVQQPHFQEKRIAAMTTLLSETKWTFEDVTKAMSTDLVQRTDEGFIKREQHLSEHLEIAELKGVVFKYDEHNPSFNVIIKPAEGGNGVLSYKDIIEVLQLSADEVSTITFSLDPPSGTERFHPFMTLRCYPRKLQDTEFMKSTFHADYLLKFFSTGIEVSAKYPYKFKPIHESLIKDLPHSLDFLQHPPYSMGVSHMSSHRFWIEIEQVTYDELHKGNQAIYYIGEVKVQIRSRPMVVNLNGKTMDAKQIEYGPHAKFARKLTDNYEELSKSFPIFNRVKELSKLQFVVQKHHEYLKRLQYEATTIFESVSKEIDRLESLHPIKTNPDSCLWVPATFNNLVYGGVLSNFESSHLEYLSRPGADQVACASDAEPAGFSAAHKLFSSFPEGGIKIQLCDLLKTPVSQTDECICVKLGDTKVESTNRRDSGVIHVSVTEEQPQHADLDIGEGSTSNDEKIVCSKTHSQEDSKQSERMSKFSDTDPSSKHASGQIKSAKVVPFSETVPDSVQFTRSGEEKSQLPFNVADADRDKTKLHSDAGLADMNDGETSPKMQARYDKKTPETLRSSTENKMKVECDKISKSVHELAPTEKSDTPVQSPTNVPEKVSLKSENAAMSSDKDTKKNANIETTSEHTGSEFYKESSNDQPNTIVKFDIDSVMSHAARHQITFLKRGAQADTLLPEFRQSLLNKAIFGEMLNDPRLQELLQSAYTFNEINFHPNILACHLIKTAIVLRKIVEYHCERGTESQII